MLIACQECNAQISEAAAACPKCGASPDAFLGAPRSCAECGNTDYRPAHPQCRACGAPQLVAIGPIANTTPANASPQSAAAQQIDYRKLEEWRNHDREVRERRKSGWRWMGCGLTLLLLGVVSALAIGFTSGWVLLAGLVMIPVGIWKRVRAGRMSASVIRDVERRRQRSKTA